MAKVITDIHGFLGAISDYLWDDDREILEQLVERFSENVVIAGDRYAVAVNIVDIAGETITISDHYAIADKLLEDKNIDFDAIIDKYRDTDQDSVGYTYQALREAVLQVYTESQCVYFTQKMLEENFENA